MSEDKIKNSEDLNKVDFPYRKFNEVHARKTYKWSLIKFVAENRDVRSFEYNRRVNLTQSQAAEPQVQSTGAVQ